MPEAAPNGILAGSDETLDLQVLLDSLHHELQYLPAFAVDIGNNASQELKDIGEKDAHAERIRQEYGRLISVKAVVRIYILRREAWYREPEVVPE